MQRISEYISAIKRAHLLHGVVVRSTVSTGVVKSIEIPDFPESVLVLTSSMIPGSNAVRVLKETMPLLAGEAISYAGQPVLAVFAPTSEMALTAARKISITYGKPEVPEEHSSDLAAAKEAGPIPGKESTDNELPASPQSPNEYRSKTIKWGSPEKLFREADTVIEHRYYTGSEDSLRSTPAGALAEEVDGVMIIHAATQWPFHVREVVSETCGLSKRKIAVLHAEYHPTHDEKLIFPSVYGALCAIAAIKTGRPARIIDFEPARRPEMEITRRTALTEDHLPLAEEVEVNINAGAFPFFADEMIQQTAAGAMPPYDIAGIKINVRIFTSANPPRHNFLGLGFSNTQFTLEAHFTTLAQRSNTSPLSWRIKHLANSKTRPADQIKIRYNLLKELLEQTAKRSDYNRKYAVYEMQKSRQETISPFYRYARGIGIACGYGITGFSKHFTEEKKHSVTVTLEEKNLVTISLSIVEPDAEKIWKQIVSEQLGVDPSEVVIQHGDTTHIPDTGPSLLRRDLFQITGLIARSCESIKSQRFKEPLPIKVKRGFKQGASRSTPPFSGLNWGAVVVELEIDSVSLEILVKGIWGTFETGRVFNEERVLSTLSKALNEAVCQCGATRRPGKEQPSIDIVIAESEQTLPTSASESGSGLIAAAFASALTQALRTPIRSLPIGAEGIMKIITGETSS